MFDAMEAFLLLFLFLTSVYILWNCGTSVSLKILILVLGVSIYLTVYPASETFMAVSVPDINGPMVAFGPSDARRHFPVLFGRLGDKDFRDFGSLRPSVFGCATELGTPDHQQVAVEVGDF